MNVGEYLGPTGRTTRVIVTESRSLAHHRVLDRPERGGGAGRDADLVVDVLNVVIGRFGGDEETIRDLTGRESSRGQPEDIDLAG